VASLVIFVTPSPTPVNRGFLPGISLVSPGSVGGEFHRHFELWFLPVSDLGLAPPGVSPPGVGSASPSELELESASEDSESRPFGSSVAVSASLVSSVP
jgi:hypothetical protein